MNLKPSSVTFRILCCIVFLHFIHIHFIRPCYCVFIYVCICVHLTNFLKTNLTKLVVNCMSERSSKGRFLQPGKLQNHSNEVKGKEKKKERGEGKEEKRKKQWFRCYFWLLWRFHVFKNPVRHTYGLPIYLLLYLNFAFETPSIVNEIKLSSE